MGRDIRDAGRLGSSVMVASVVVFLLRNRFNTQNGLCEPPRVIFGLEFANLRIHEKKRLAIPCVRSEGSASL